MDFVANLRGTIAPSSRSNFGGGGRQIAEERIARSTTNNYVTLRDIVIRSLLVVIRS
jgi:hypothetical protein